MAPSLGKRQFYGRNCYQNSDGSISCDSSAWYDWVRWVVLAAIILFFVLLFVLCSCMTARRRRRMGQQPYYGTGWANRIPYHAHPHNAATTQQQWTQPAPPYDGSHDAPPPDYGNHAGGYYAAGRQQQQQGSYGSGPDNYELQQPGGSFQPPGRERGEYAPPMSPPPGKKGGADVYVR